MIRKGHAEWGTKVPRNEEGQGARERKIHKEKKDDNDSKVNLEEVDRRWKKEDSLEEDIRLL